MANQLRVQIKLTRNVQSLHDLRMVAEGLQEIDDMAESWLNTAAWGPPYPEEYFWIRRRGRPPLRAQIEKFEIASPPQIVLQCSIEWLAIYLALAALGWNVITGTWGMIATYEDVQRNLGTIRTNIVDFVASVQGMTAGTQQQVLHIVDLYLDGLLESAAINLQIGLGHIRRIQEARARLALPTDPVQSRISVEEDPKQDQEESGENPEE